MPVSNPELTAAHTALEVGKGTPIALRNYSHVCTRCTLSSSTKQTLSGQIM